MEECFGQRSKVDEQLLFFPGADEAYFSAQTRKGPIQHLQLPKGPAPFPWVPTQTTSLGDPEPQQYPQKYTSGIYHWEEYLKMERKLNLGKII